MKQRSAKKHREWRGFEVIFLLLAAVLFVVAATEAPLSAKAQELIPAAQDSTSATEETSVSAEQLLGALENGGLLANGNLGIKTSSSPKTAVDSQPAMEPDQTAPKFDSAAPNKMNSDTFEYLEAQGGLVAGAAIAKTDSGNPTIFKLAAKFLDEVIFKNSTEFLKKARFEEGFEVSGQPIFDQDTAGYAVIKKGNQSVEVQFGKKYKTAPVVTVSLSVQQYDDPEVRSVAEDLLLISNVNYVVTNVTAEGFEIMMDRASDSDIPFSWHALSVQDPNIFKKEAKDRKSNDSQNESGGLSVSGKESKSSNSIMGIIGQSTDSSPLPDSGENGSSAPAGDASQNGAPAGLSGNNSSP